MKTGVVLVSAFLWLACANAAPRDDTNAASVEALLQGRFDNREQVAAGPRDEEHAIPSVTVTLEPTPQKDFTLWRVRLETDPQSTFEQTWAMQLRLEGDGSGALIPYYELKQDAAPAAAAFDPQGWLSLEACALRGTFAPTHFEAISEGEPCVAVSMNVGARRALLPVAVERGGDSLQVYLSLRGKRTHIEAKRVP